MTIISCIFISHLSFVHFIVGVGSPTELHGSRTSFIQGVVTVPPNERIFAGARERRQQRGINTYIFSADSNNKLDLQVLLHL